MANFRIIAQDDLEEEDALLVAKAADVLPNAYADYSSFCVGAALLLENGVIVTGTNQENAAYPSGMCAERVALYSAAAQYPGTAIRKLAVVAKGKDDPTLSPATCCGGCRQVMLEFEHRQAKPFRVIMLHINNEWIIAPSAESLLPYSFKKSNLKNTNLAD